MESLKNCKFYDENSNTDEPFQIACPTKPMEPKMKSFPKAPDKWDAKFQPQLGLMTRVFKSKRDEAIAEAERLYKNAYECWEDECKKTILINKMMRKKYVIEMDAFRNNVAVWDVKKAEYLKNQKGEGLL